MSTAHLLLENIEYPEDLRKLNNSQLPQLCDELRQFIIDSVLMHGGHFAANLGVVELTVAIHYVFNTPDDRLVWDVGHQAYGHKILTGRRKLFHTNRRLGGLSGFPKISESQYDAFGTGHSSTALSAALGMACAALLNGNTTRNHIAVVGDGALTAGQAFEALNNMSVSQSNILLIVNDNDIGIDLNNGAINHHLNQIDPKNNLFTIMGLEYEGPVDGHDVLKLVQILEEEKNRSGPRVLHVKTIKGKGYTEAEKEQTKWHSTPKYVKIEDPEHQKVLGKQKYQDVFGETLIELARQDKNTVGVTPAMPTGSGMIKAMTVFPNRFFDVGIAEQHAVTFAAGLASEGLIVFCSMYSTFLQRALDQVIHDVCLQEIPVIFCIDRAGNVGDDGPTHHGLYDIALLSVLPNITLLAPSTGSDLRNMMHFYSKNRRGPVAIRYPKGYIHGSAVNWDLKPSLNTEPEITESADGEGIAILCVGNLLETGLQVKDLLKEQGMNAAVYDVQRIKPLDEKGLGQIMNRYHTILTVEDGILSGGFGSQVKNFAVDQNFKGKCLAFGFPDEVIEHGSSEELMRKHGLDAEGIFELLKKYF